MTGLDLTQLLHSPPDARENIGRGGGGGKSGEESKGGMKKGELETDGGSRGRGGGVYMSGGRGR